MLAFKKAEELDNTIPGTCWIIQKAKEYTKEYIVNVQYVSLTIERFSLVLIMTNFEIFFKKMGISRHQSFLV